MPNDFKFRVLTSEDWKNIKHDTLETLADDRGLKLKDGETDGIYTSECLDSGLEGCHWHRIVLDADIPENSELSVCFSSSDGVWSEPIDFRDNRDALLQELFGRYIRLKIDFHCDGKKSPLLRQAKIYYPRRSYLRYLPAVYQEDTQSKEFLERFLSIFESILYDSNETISNIPTFFDPTAAPKDFVPWLARWLSLDLYELLGDKNREFILRAAELYKRKGTAAGIASLVSFLTGKKCCVKEYMNNIFRTYGMENRWKNEIEISDRKDCPKFYRNISKTVDTGNLDLLTNIGTYHDTVHYVPDTSKTGRYSSHVIGLFIFLPTGEKLIIKEDELREIINSFLPVFVRAEIITVEVPLDEVYDLNAIIEKYKDHVCRFLEEDLKGVKGVYKDTVNWNWLCTYSDSYNGNTNDLKHRTPHDKINREITL